MVLAMIPPLVLALMTVAGANGAEPFATLSFPAPTYMGMAIVVLPLENNATVEVQCVAFADGDLRQTFWFLQLVGEEKNALIAVDNGGIAVFSGRTRENVTIVKFPSDLHRAVILCGPNDIYFEPRFLLTFPGN